MKREVKIGLFAVGMIGCLWAGVRFLSGIDIFSRNVDYYAAYDQINGVQTASPIMIRGVKVGTVTDISFDPRHNDRVVLRFTIKRQYPIPVNSEAKIFSTSIMGAKAIEISLGDSDRYLQRGDTLIASRDRDIMDVAGSELEYLKQKVSQVTADLSQTLGSVHELIERNAASIEGTMTHLNSISGNVDRILASERENLRAMIADLSTFSDMLARNAPRMDSVIGNVDRFAGQLAQSDLTARLDSVLLDLDATIRRLNRGEGTLGLLLNDSSLYYSLDEATANLSALLADLKAYPARYVRFSLIGSGRRRERKEREAAEQAAAAAALRTDSIHPSSR